MSGGFGDRINLKSGDIRWYVGGVWTPPPSGASFWTIVVQLDSAPFNLARLILRNGATFGKRITQFRCHLQAQAGFAHATSTGQGEQPYLFTLQEVLHCRHFLLASDELGQLDG